MGESLRTRAHHRRPRTWQGGLAMLAAFTLLVATVVATPGAVLADDDAGDVVVPLTSSAPTSSINPDLAPACGIDLTVILDESGSIGNAGAENDVRDATLALLAGLNNTGSRVNFVEFDTTARLANPGGGGTAYRTVNDGLIADVAGYFAGTGNSPTTYQPNAWTNWDDAWFQSWQQNQSSPPQLAIFITDGNPNTVIGGRGGGADWDVAAAAAIDDTNAYKAAGTHLLGIAVGRVTLSRIQLVTGPDIWSGSGFLDLRTTDVIDVGSFDDLDDALRQVVYALCAPSVTINKDVIDGNGEPANAGAGWEFAGTVTVDEGTYEWTNPPAGIVPPASTRHVRTTGGGGFVTFQWTPGSVDSPEPWVSNFSYEELASPDGRDFVFVEGSCDIERLENDGTVTVFEDIALAPGEPIEVQKADIVTCDVLNAVAGLTVEKEYVGYVDNGDDTFSVFYDIDVVNESAFVATDYTLVDTAAFTSGVSVVGASIDGEPLIPGAGPWIIATSEPLAPSTTASHSVEVQVSPAHPEPYLACDSTPGHGLYNSAALSFEGGADSDWDCGDLASVTVLKTVVNDDGGTARPGDFVIRLDGDPVISGVPTILEPGEYTVTEDDPGPAYLMVGDSCDGTVFVEEGEQATCVITNDDVGGTLELEKIVVNEHGGEAVASDWMLTAEGPTVVSGPGGFDATRIPAGDYALTEIGPDGYAASAWTCNGEPLVENVVSVGLAEAVFCSITNMDVAAFLSLEKIVVNDNGGTAVPAAWELFATGPTVLSGQGSASGLVPAGTYTLSEEGPSGYETDGWSCEGGEFDAETNRLSLALGDSASCVVTNDDEPAFITVVKEVVNDAGGTASTEDFLLTVAPAGGEPVAVIQGTPISVNAGVAHTIGEVSVDGYEMTDITCVAFGDDEPAVVDHPVTLEPGQEVTCSVINDDIAPTLAVEVQVHSGAALPDDFDPTITGDFEETGLVASVRGLDLPVTADHVVMIKHVHSGEPIEVMAGHYYATAITLMEGYVQVGEHICNDEVTGAPVEYPVYPVLGQQVFCTYQVEMLPSITVVKVASPAEGAFDFTLTPVGTDVTADTQTVSGDGGTHTWQFVEPGIYELTEVTPTDWSLESVTCGQHETEPLADGVRLEVGFGEAVSCTFSNASQQADLSIVKTDVTDPIFVNSTDRIGVIVYRLSIENAGPAAATAVTVVDTLDPTTTFSSAVPSQGSCAHSAGVVTCELGDIAVGASASITILATTLDVEEIDDIVVDNTAVVSGDQTDVDPSNNTDVEDTTLVPVLQEEILPDTGMDVTPWALFSLVLLAAGWLLLRAGTSDTGGRKG